MLQTYLREQVLEANLLLVGKGLVLSTFGNASGVARDEGLIVIKPSGLPYDEMKAEHLVVTDLQGKVVEGTLRPSSDLPTHAVLYRAFPSIGGIAHTQSEYATAWAQARKPVPCFGTTHADAFHGPFAWGPDPGKAAENAWALEVAARLAYLTMGVDAHASSIGKTLQDRHFLRKHGKSAYYGQVRTDA
jgi:L-ribulose-5-phosphate 4-epimerase